MTVATISGFPLADHSVGTRLKQDSSAIVSRNDFSCAGIVAADHVVVRTKHSDAIMVVAQIGASTRIGA
jgi:hypothetical protein